MLFNEIIISEPITKGWSCDKKYSVTTKDGTKYLLRITPYEKSESRRALFEILKKVSVLNIPMCIYVYGLKAGEILKKIHTIPTPETKEDWHTRFNRKTDLKIKKYYECGIRFQGDTNVLEYLSNNRDIFKNRPQSFQHGDYQNGNMMIENGKLVIIDFDHSDFGDPWEEFNRIVWCVQTAQYFA